MKNSIIALLAVFMLFFNASSDAALITDLPSDTYITSAGVDWTWASRWGTGSILAPELPSFHDGWRFATTAELDYLFENLVNLFLNSGDPIESTAYWNAPAEVGVNTWDLSDGYIMSGPNMMSYGNGLACTGSTPCDTFYVREVSEPVDVPAPASLPLLFLSLLGFALTRRKVSVLS
ncbi:hypothetical protein tinsulaeT_12420 [Thalassotalea insulae]|uniref:PEP-CTERM sorting domain-containing protein n=1 Tax=Thalassotalea insulae TaxID=2056778 RepID=A0ABQ6GR66_9GAMM|nr:PEP-CTERM sorting domain-containing protein [Thalassotalea insulae]GLX77902.1 hypothetical protein tinsulaeT_12420 [Thalassotalea insulae]